MRSLLHDWGQLVEIDWAAHAASRAGAHPPGLRDADAAFGYLTRFACDPLDMLALRGLLVDDCLDVAGMRDVDVLRRVAYRIACGALVVDDVPSLGGGGDSAAGAANGAPRRRASDATGGVAADRVAPRSPPPPARPGPTRPAGTRSPSTTPADVPSPKWVEFRILDEETGEPVRGVALRLRLPDGSLVTRVTNADGLVRVTDLRGGMVDIVRIVDDDAFEVLRLE